jgi:ATP-binding cassette subfamily F protein uup
MTQRVSTLSGGEQNRLLLAKLFAQSHNFLVLDEPTNDLDMETLELLQEVIADYDGTVLIVSHDRDFLDRTVTAILAFDGDGKIVAHAGGYSDYLARRKATNSGKDNKDSKTKSAKKPKPASSDTRGQTTRLSFKDKHALDTLPDEIAALEQQINALDVLLADPNLFNKDPDKFNKAAEAHVSLRAEKEAKELQWLAVAEKAEQLDG